MIVSLPGDPGPDGAIVKPSLFKYCWSVNTSVFLTGKAKFRVKIDEEEVGGGTGWVT